MGAPGRIYISCAEADAKEWRERVLKAWAPLETNGNFELWHREKAEDIGSEIEYHVAVLLVTENYFGDKLAAGEFDRFINFPLHDRRLCWIPIQDTLYKLKGLDKITPAWGFRKGEEKYATVVELPEKQYSSVWTEVATDINQWWSEKGSKLPEKLEDTRLANRVLTEPKPPPPIDVSKLKDPGKLRLLPCLIDRLPQETPVRRRLASREGKIVFIMPGQREERPDRFADRLDSYTIAKLRAKNDPKSNLEFCRIGWPSYVEGDSAPDRFEEYLDGVFTSVRLDFTIKSDPEIMTAAAEALRQRMKETRYLFWTEVTAGAPGKTSKDMFTAVFAWWKQFLPGPGTDFFPPVVVLALTTAKNTLPGFLPDSPLGEHVEEMNELAPIGYQDMVNWVDLTEIRGFDSGSALRSKINELYTNNNERISFATVEKQVMQWLAAST